MARILGLDLGSHSLKALWLETTMRSTTVSAFASARVPPPTEGSLELLPRIQKALSELLASSTTPIDQIVVALPGPSLATHAISLPFGDPKRIEATISFEVESQLPYDLSEAIFDYQMAGGNDKKSDLLIGVVRKPEMSALLAMLQSVKLEPRIVTHPGMVLFHLLPTPAPGRSAVDAEGATAIVDLGHERTNVAIGRRLIGVEMARTFAAGGKDITRAISNEFQVSLEEAERWKEAHSAVGSAAGYGPDAERAQSACLRGFQSILRELRPTLKSYAAKTHIPIERVVICGGTSRIKGLDDLLSRELGIPTERLQFESNGKIEADQQALAGQAFALAQRGAAPSGRNAKFNLRRGDFAFKGDLDYVKDKVPQLAAMLLILFTLFLGSGWTRSFLLEQQKKAVEKKFCDVTQNIIGRCEKDPRVALSLMKGQESPAASIPRISAVNLLAEVTQRLPSSVTVKIDRIDVELDRIALRLETDSSKSVDEITSALKAYSCFKEVQEGKIEKSADGQKVNVQLKIEVECPTSENAQG